jgi:hypothetical protein
MILALKRLYQRVDHFRTACLALRKCLMRYLFIVLWFVLLVAIDSDAPTLDKFQDLQKQDFEQSIYWIAC